WAAATRRRRRAPLQTDARPTALICRPRPSCSAPLPHLRCHADPRPLRARRSPCTPGAPQGPREEGSMVSIPSLWLPILLSAVFVFFLSWIIHMFLPYHRTDYGKLPSEADVQEALRKFDIAPGDYLLPCPEGPTGMRSPEYLEKRNRGP